MQAYILAERGARSAVKIRSLRVFDSAAELVQHLDDRRKKEYEKFTQNANSGVYGNWTNDRLNNEYRRFQHLSIWWKSNFWGVIYEQPMNGNEKPRTMSGDEISKLIKAQGYF